MTDNSFWQRVEQQTTTTAGLGYITSDPIDPSLSYWPGPGLIPPFKVGREWISHYTSFQYCETSKESAARDDGLKIDDVGSTLAGTSTQQSQDTAKFASEILITYKLKNPSQFLRDIICLEDISEFASRFDHCVPLYIMTGYKISRNVQTALEQQDSTSNSIKFHLSTKAKVVATPLGSLAVPSGSFGDNEAHSVLSTIDYQAPGDSIFFIRYQRIIMDKAYPGTILLPPNPISWWQWFFSCDKRPLTTVIVKKDRGSTQQILITHRPIVSALKSMSHKPQLQLTGRQSTLVSCDESDLICPRSEDAPYTSSKNGADPQRSGRATEVTPLLRK